jgi:aminobenzoyl-glutamate utilization protein B
VDWEIIHGNHPVLVNETLQQMMDEVLRQLPAIQYSAADREFAEKIRMTLGSTDLTLGSEQEVQPYSISLGYGSTDVGDVSMAVPTVGARIASYVPGTAGHSWQAVAAGGTSVGFRGADMAARALSSAAIELYTDAALRDAAIEEFERKRGEDFTYEALLGDREPPLDYRR